MFPLKFVLFCMEMEGEDLKYSDSEAMFLVTFCNQHI
jgi:hypothetical protein